MPRSASQLTDDEATFVGLLVRMQPATAYQISKVYAESPVSNFGTSKGKIYPMIRRLKERGLISARTLTGDGRNSEVLSATARGRVAVRKWVNDIRPDQLLPEDPLRTMVQSFDVLSRDEQLQWISRARSGLEAKLHELEEYGASVSVPFKDHVHDNAITSVESRLAWLDRMEARFSGKLGERDRSRPAGAE